MVVIIFVVIWWIVFFMVLPFGNQAVENPETGHERGAPAKPRLGLKACITTVLAIIFTIVFYFFISP